MEEKPVETTVYSLTDAPPAPSDRRESERQLTLFRVGSLVIGDRRELCLIKNVSAGGMMIRAYCAIEPGTRVSVELKCGEAVAGSALWVEGETIGLAFDEPVDVVGLLATSMQGPRPRMPRIEVDCVASIREGATVHRVMVRDVSQGGIKVATEKALGVGADVMVTLAGLAPVAGVVRWSESGCYGVTFNRVLPLPLLVGWLHEQRERLRAAG
ncbi:MAG TPA: PilZ domain-containing protein [Sphingomicrobium sp.]|nr:PilZ domain-containing protein [Sphingomicrobium sp.]